MSIRSLFVLIFIIIYLTSLCLGKVRKIKKAGILRGRKGEYFTVYQHISLSILCFHTHNPQALHGAFCHGSYSLIKSLTTDHLQLKMKLDESGNRWHNEQVAHYYCQILASVISYKKQAPFLKLPPSIIWEHSSWVTKYAKVTCLHRLVFTTHPPPSKAACPVAVREGPALPKLSWPWMLSELRPSVSWPGRTHTTPPFYGLSAAATLLSLGNSGCHNGQINFLVGARRI